jgi:flavodoxin
MNILIVFFSWKRHTETVARAVSEKTGGTVVRIEPVVDPGTRIGRMGMRAFFGRKEQIKPVRTDLTGVDHLVIATPVWAHNIPPFTRQYLSELTNCTGIKFSVLAEMGGSGAERVVKIIRKILEAKGMQFVASAATIEKDVEAGKVDEIIEEFAKKIKAG